MPAKVCSLATDPYGLRKSKTISKTAPLAASIVPTAGASRKETEAVQSAKEGPVRKSFPENRNNAVGGAVDNTRNQLEGIYGIGNQEIDGVTVGTGTCEDCVWGETEGHNCRPCRRRRDEVAGTEDRGKFHFRNDALGENDRKFIRKLVNEIREELAEDTGDVAGIGFGPPHGTLGIDDEEVDGTSERLRDTARTSFRLHGSNGCSW